MLDGEADPRHTHIYPINDVREHVLIGLVCWCGPKIERLDNDEVLIIHSAADGRTTQDMPYLHGGN